MRAYEVSEGADCEGAVRTERERPTPDDEALTVEGVMGVESRAAFDRTFRATAARRWNP